MSRIRVVLFDLGGVLVELGGVAEFGQLIGESDEERVWERWLRSEAVRSFERGSCDAPTFGRDAVTEFGLEISADDFLARFTAWPKGLYPGALELVRGVRQDLDIACLSNTNVLHWERQLGAPDIHGLFPTRFLSHEIGCVKPDDEAYHRVVGELGCAPSEILFLDDNALNVEGAQRVGLQAARVRGVEETRATLTAHGLLR